MSVANGGDAGRSGRRGWQVGLGRIRRWSGRIDAFDLVAVAGLFVSVTGVAFTTGLRSALTAVEKPASRALRVERPDGVQPTVRGVVQLLELLERQVTTDLVTGLRSRSAILLDHALAVATAHEHVSWHAVVVLDVDRFKHINDRYGHRIGDEVLAALAQRITDAVGESGTVGRYGGEEFLVVLPKHDVNDGLAQSQRILEALRSSPIRVGEIDIPVTASAGIAASYGERCSVDGLIDAADAAMYQAKLAGRDRVVVADSLNLVYRARPD